MNKPTGRRSTCPPWCSDHFEQIGVCEAAPIFAPGGEIRMCADPVDGVYVSLYVEVEALTPAEADQVAYSILAMTARARAAGVTAIPTLIAS